MTDLLDRIRAAALALPETAERDSDGQPGFVVADQPFVQLLADDRGGRSSVVCVRTGGAEEQAMLIEALPDTYLRSAYRDDEGWIAMHLRNDADWSSIENRIARSWELAAPRALLEAGGR